MKEICLLALLSIFQIYTASVALSQETKNGIRAKAPIRHQKYFRTEKELFGYNPKFTPGTVNFDLKNRPYIIAAKDKPLIQTMDENNQWITLDFGKDIKRKYPQWNGYIRTDQFGSSRITFDKDGDAYYYAATGRSNLNKALLLYSKDNCRNWQVYDLPYVEFGRLEVKDTFNLKENPPAILFYEIRNRSKGEFRLITLEKTADGKLKLSSPILITNDSLLCPLHSGDGNFCVSHGDNIFIVWATNKDDGKKGVRHFAAAYNRKTKSLSAPSYIGRSNAYIKNIDNHCLPVITVDSKGYLHVVLGTHHHPSSYAKSLKPDDITAWTTPEEFGVPKKRERGEGSYTYPSINCDLNDNINVVSRWAGYSYYFCLVYNMRSAATGKWLPQHTLVQPFRNMYGCWYHRVSIDRKGRLFVYYINFLNQLDKKSLETYNRKWPEDKVNLNPKKSGDWDYHIKPHSPAILMQSTRKSPWFLAVTPDFTDGIIKE